MQTVKLPDGTTLQFPDDMSQDAMRTAINGYLSKQPAAQERPSGWVDAGKSFLGGLGRGAAGLVDLAGTWGTPTVRFGEDMRVASMEAAPEPARAGLAAATGGGSEYQPQTTAGEYARTVGEFLPGAALAVVTGGGSMGGNLMRYGVVPALTSEAAGQLTEGTRIEPAARLVGALAGPSVASGAERIARRIVSPLGGADAVRMDLAKVLDDYGVPVTAGQRTGSARAMRAEGSQAPSAAQNEAFTKAVLGTIGEQGASRATPEVLRAAQARIGDAIETATSGVAVTPNANIGSQVVDIVDNFRMTSAGAEPAGAIARISNAIMDQATAPRPQAISGATLREWRTALGPLTSSSAEPVRDAARALRGLIDDMTENALFAAGRRDDLTKLLTARQQYRNYLAVSDAASRAGPEIAAGILNPQVVRSAVARSIGGRNYATGRGTDLTELSRAGAGVLAPLPTVEAGGARHIPEMARAAGVYGGAATMGPVGAVAGLLAPEAFRAAVNSRPLQAYLANQLMAPGAALPRDLRLLAPGVSGLLAQ